MTRKTIESKLPEFKGAKFTLHKMSEARRIRFSNDQAPLIAEIRLIQEEIDALTAPLRNAEGKLPNDVKLDAATLNLIDKANVFISYKINTSWMAHGLYKVEGMKDDEGNDVTPETFAENASSELYHEVLDAIKAESGLSPAETKN